MGIISQPGSSVKFTNVSQVRMRKGDKRFEIMCYRNKVQDWRADVEKDIDEVVQVQQVFVNAGKGEVASSQDLKKHFGTTDVAAVVLEILNKGELQVGGKERQQQQTQLHNTVLGIIASKVMNPEKMRPYPPSIIEKVLSMLDFRFSNKPAKGQALEAIKMLVNAQIIPIARARMRIRVSDDTERDYFDELKSKIETVESETTEDGSWEIIGLINPSDFRDIDALVHAGSGNTGIVEVMAMTDDLHEA